MRGGFWIVGKGADFTGALINLDHFRSPFTCVYFIYYAMFEVNVAVFLKYNFLFLFLEQMNKFIAAKDFSNCIINLKWRGEEILQQYLPDTIR